MLAPRCWSQSCPWQCSHVHLMTSAWLFPVAVVSVCQRGNVCSLCAAAVPLLQSLVLVVLLPILLVASLDVWVSVYPDWLLSVELSIAVLVSIVDNVLVGPTLPVELELEPSLELVSNGHPVHVVVWAGVVMVTASDVVIWSVWLVCVLVDASVDLVLLLSVLAHSPP